MATLENINEWADDLEQECPEKLPKRLQWFACRLGIDRNRLLHLMGLSSRQIKQIGRTPSTNGTFDWEKIVARHQTGAAWVDDAINQLLAFFHYNVAALADRLKRPASDGEYLIPRPGGELVGLDQLNEAERERLLLEQIAQGDGRSIPALLVYLSSPSNGSAAAP